MTAWQFTPIAYLYLIAAASALYLGVYAYQLRPVRGTNYFCLLSISVSIWTLGYILGLLNTSLSGKLLFLRLEYLGIIATNIFWLLFIITYIYHNHWLTKTTLTLLSIIPIITYIQILTVEQHTFFYRVYETTTVDNLVVTHKVYGTGFILWTIYAYTTFFIGEMLLIWSIFRMPDQFRKQAIPIVFIVAMAMVPNFLYITNSNPIAPYDPTPLPFVISSILFVLMIRHYGFLNIVPVAHNLIFKNVNSGIIILDEYQRIIDINAIATNIINSTQQDILGKPLTNFFPEIKNHIQAENQKSNIEITKDEQTYELQATPLSYHKRESAGQILMLYNVTARTLLEQQQNLLIKELKEALDQVKTLTGLLPICANCKQIRDKDGSWQQVETYIQSRSKAHFTHSICPTCVEELYPDYIQRRKQKST